MSEKTEIVSWRWRLSNPSTFWLILALLKVEKKLKCRFDSMFDQGIYEQSWAICQGLAEWPDDLRVREML